MDSDAKGRELENAVHAIEAVILQSSPTLHDKAFAIEARKRIAVGGVHHEIDIFVIVEVAKGYTSIFIFECKNWEDAVGKNELIVFSEKIDATSAQRGFFVAKSFTKDAAAQAQKDPRITLLTATEHDPETTITPESFHLTAPASLKPTITFRVAGSSGKNVSPIDVQGKKVRLHGQEVLLTEFLDDWIKELYSERLLHFTTAHLSEGIHPMTASGKRSFGAGECIINDQEMEHVQMDLECGVEIIHPVVLSDYEVSSRGRVIRLAPVKIHNVVIETAFVTTHKE
jgi:hypothetical protein